MAGLRNQAACATLRCMPYRVNRKQQMAGCAAASGLLALILLLPVAHILAGPYSETYPRRFNSQQWIAASGTVAEDTIRCGMLGHLKWRVGLEGRDREEVISMLGEPDDKRHEPDVSYWMLCPSFLDVWVLGTRWENGRVAEVIIHDT